MRSRYTVTLMIVYAVTILSIIKMCLLFASAADVIVHVGNGPQYKDGDILHAANDRRIAEVHVSNICNKRNFGFNKHGLRAAGTVLDAWMQKRSKYVFRRISKYEIQRVTLATDAVEVLSNKPNSDGEYMNVPLFLQRRLKSKQHLIFGTPGAEYWYGGAVTPSQDDLNVMWDLIEQNTAYDRKDYTQFPYTERELKQHLALKVDDMTDAEASDAMAPLMSEPEDEDEEPVMLKKRKNRLDYKNDLGFSEAEKADIENVSKKKDYRKTKSAIKLKNVLKAKAVEVIR